MLAGWVLTDKVGTMGEYCVDFDGAASCVSLHRREEMRD